MVLALAAGTALYAEDVVTCAMSGVVKSVDKTSKDTMVVKTKDGTEQTIKWTDKTTAEGCRQRPPMPARPPTMAPRKAPPLLVKYTEKAGEKGLPVTDEGSKATAKATKKAADKTADAVK